MRWMVMAGLLGAQSWTFEKDEPGRPPAGFEFATTAQTPAGRWEVLKDGDNQVLAQLDKNETGKRYAMAVVKDSSLLDLRLSVRGKPISGDVDQTVGLVWRYQDSENYYVARTNVLESNVRLYRVVKGKREQFAGKEKVDFKAGEWQALAIEQKGVAMKVFLNKQLLFEGQDGTIDKAGKVGVWIKADSVTWFDDLAVEELK